MDEHTEQTEFASSDQVIPEGKPNAQAAEQEAKAEEQAKPDSTIEGMIGHDEPLVQEGMQWFVLRVASNKENSVQNTLLRKIQIENMTHLVGRILVPTEKIKTIKGGKAKIKEEKLYAGYVFVEMRLEEDGRIPQDIFFLIKETTGVGDFIGSEGKPTKMNDHDVVGMLAASQKAEEQPGLSGLNFQKGDEVKVTEGSFENFEGIIDTVDEHRGMVTVLLTIFGRSTPVEVEYWQLEKM